MWLIPRFISFEYFSHFMIEPAESLIKFGQTVMIQVKFFEGLHSVWQNFCQNCLPNTFYDIGQISIVANVHEWENISHLNQLN